MLRKLCCHREWLADLFLYCLYIHREARRELARRLSSSSLIFCHVCMPFHEHNPLNTFFLFFFLIYFQDSWSDEYCRQFSLNIQMQVNFRGDQGMMQQAVFISWFPFIFPEFPFSNLSQTWNNYDLWDLAAEILINFPEVSRNISLQLLNKIDIPPHPHTHKTNKKDCRIVPLPICCPIWKFVPNHRFLVSPTVKEIILSFLFLTICLLFNMQ